MTPEEAFIDQHPDALRLTLVEGNLDHSPFTLLASDSCSAHGLFIRATVIGASHIVTFGGGSFVLNEVFACTGLADVASWTLEALATNTVERQLPGMRYEFSVRTIPWQDPEPLDLVELVSEAHRFVGRDGTIGVVQAFPAAGCTAIPKTVIVGHAGTANKGFVVRTAHSYPNVRGLVLSTSTLYFT